MNDPLSEEAFKAFEKWAPRLPYSHPTCSPLRAWQECARRAREEIKRLDDENEAHLDKCMESNQLMEAENKRLRELLKSVCLQLRASNPSRYDEKLISEVYDALEGKE